MKLSRTLLPALWLTISMGLLGCTDDISDTVRHREGEFEASVPFTVDGEIEQTRGIMANARETRVEEAYIMFFSEEDNTLAAVKKANVKMSGGTSKLTFDIPLEIEPSNEREHKYQVLLVGNCNSFLPSGFNSTEDYLNTFGNQSYGEVNGKLAFWFSTSVTARYPGIMPLWGRFVSSSDTDRTIDFSYKTEGEGPEKQYFIDGEFRFSRSICRIDLTNLCEDALDVKWVKVCNYRTGGFAYTDGIVPDGSKIVTLDEAQAEPDADNPGEYMPAESTDGKGQVCNASLYCFPNIVNTTVVNDKVTTCLIIAGYYYDKVRDENGNLTGEVRKDTKLSYYRFNLANLGEAQLLKRNFVYTAVIKGVLDRGRETDKEAYEYNIPLFDYSVEDEWDATDDNYVTDGQGNFLVLSKTFLTFPGNYDSKNRVQVKVSTNDLVWRIEPVDKIGADYNHFECYPTPTAPTVSLDAGPKAPRDKNDKYVIFGYYKVVAENKDPNGKKVHLEKQITLQHLTIDEDAALLTVDNSVGTIERTLAGSGGSITLPVMTGSDIYVWSASSSNFTTSSFGNKAKFTTQGGNNQNLIITAGPNTTNGERRATIKVSHSDPNIQPVYVQVVQPKSNRKIQDVTMSRLESGDTYVEDGHQLTLNCFSTATDNPNGIAKSVTFAVHLMDPDNYVFDVTSSFDQNLDLCIHETDNLTGSIQAIQTGMTDSWSAKRKRSLSGLSDGMFTINAFRMGPNDKNITGSIIIKARHKSNRNLYEDYVVSVTLKSTKCLIYDVILNQNGTYYMIPDRTLGMSPRSVAPESKFYATQSGWKINSDSGTEFLNSNGDFRETQQWMYKLDHWYLGTTWPSQPSVGASGNEIAKFIARHLDSDGYYSPFYKNATSWNTYGWAYNKKPCFSKGRGYWVSDVNNGINVCCWLQQVPVPEWNIYTSGWGSKPVAGAYISGNNYGWGLIDYNGFRCPTTPLSGGSSHQYMWGASRPVRTMSSSEVNQYRNFLNTYKQRMEQWKTENGIALD